LPVHLSPAARLLLLRWARSAIASALGLEASDWPAGAEVNPDGMRPGGMNPGEMGAGGTNPDGMRAGGMAAGGVDLAGLDLPRLDLAGRDLEGRDLEGLDPGLREELEVRRGAFVTITKGGELRGCIGRLDFDQPLWFNVVEAAVASAFQDPRFPPLAPEELAQVQLEISVIEPLQPLVDLSVFQPHRHGIVIERGWQRGLLLPQVARERGWGAHETLEAVCWKAGLEPDAWRDPRSRLWIFDTVEFSEPALAERTKEQRSSTD
jgi:AmmeMemoRadiSam system protein A